MSGAAAAAAAAVDRDRLWRAHEDLARIGATGRGGVDRQALTPAEGRARRLIADRAAAAGWSVFTDAIGNLFVRREGGEPALPPVLTGSHIDTQPTGGKYDGAFGVLAGLEALAALDRAGIATRRAIEVVAWTNEEGSRFAPGMMGSEAFAGVRPLDAILAVRDADGVSVADALAPVLAATPEAVHRPLGRRPHAFVEAHIEQGPVLEAAGRTIGVVTAIQGVHRMRVAVSGEEAHAGTTGRGHRKDALLAAARMIAALGVHLDAVDPADELRFTVGMLRASPNVPSVVASHVLFSIDLRHPDDAVMRRLADAVEPICRREAGPCGVAVTELARAGATVFHGAAIEAVRAAAAGLGLPWMELPSGAGHDARQLARLCPTAMIFVPCAGGVSHNEAESATADDLAAGTRVLAHALATLAA